MRGLALERTLVNARRATRARMRATCTIRRPKPGEYTVDPVTNQTTPAYEDDDVYSGVCYTRYPGLAHAQNPTAGGVTFTVSPVTVRIPLGARVLTNDVVTIDTDVDNPQMVGATLRVQSADDQSQPAELRLLCDDYQAGVAAVDEES